MFSLPPTLFLLSVRVPGSPECPHSSHCTGCKVKWVSSHLSQSQVTRLTVTCTSCTVHTLKIVKKYSLNRCSVFYQNRSLSHPSSQQHHSPHQAPHTYHKRREEPRRGVNNTKPRVNRILTHVPIIGGGCEGRAPFNLFDHWSR